jgi:inner membrane protein
MDNLCHTLVGAAFGEAGLKRRTRLGTATLMVASNLPDLDVLVFATDIQAVSFRRGWTHGVLAQALLPVALTGIVLLLARVRPPRPDDPPVNGWWLLALAYLGVGLHVFLDYLNNYGIRLLAPFDWRWFYGDAVFIIDPWLWLALGAGVLLARRRESFFPARGALVCAGCYVAAMLLSAAAARQVVTTIWQVQRGTEPRALMVGPVPITPLTRAVIVDAGTHYETGTFTWWPTRVVFDPERIQKNDSEPEVAIAARQSRDVRGFLVWSRFPFWVVDRAADRTHVTVTDARFMATGVRFSATAAVDRGDRTPGAPQAD